jgi:squalene-hopene/tetraprenyl-beta-curcumene cyclase
MKTVRRPFPNFILLFFLCGASLAGAAQTTVVDQSHNESFKFEIQHAIDQGVAWLTNAQSADGSWSIPDQPALASLALIALQGDPGGSANDPARRARLEKGYDYLMRCVHADGIYGKREMVNYNTSIASMAFAAAKNPKYHSVIQNARNNIIHWQYDAGQKGVADTPLDGGISYGSAPKAPDMANTLQALEALYYTRSAAPDKPASGDDLNWKAAIQFIQNCQHLPAYNKQDWVSDDPANLGGFIYAPGNSKAGEMDGSNGRKALRAYGSISYGGMLSYIYAGLKADDPRVTAVLDWARRNYTLEENPGMGAQGLYFYLHTMTKALTAAGTDALATSDGKEHNWRKEIGLRLINLQQRDGSWSNENGRWWEKDPVLVTSYCVLSLEMLYRGL